MPTAILFLYLVVLFCCCVVFYILLCGMDGRPMPTAILFLISSFFGLFFLSYLEHSDSQIFLLSQLLLKNIASIANSLHKNIASNFFRLLLE